MLLNEGPCYDKKLFLACHSETLGRRICLHMEADSSLHSVSFKNDNSLKSTVLRGGASGHRT